MRATQLLVLLTVVVGHAAARRGLFQGPLVGTGTQVVPTVPANATQPVGVPPVQPAQPAVAQPQAQQVQAQQAAALAAQQQQQQQAAALAAHQQQAAALAAQQKQQQAAAALAAQQKQQQAAALAAQQKQQQQAAALAAQQKQQQAQQQAQAAALQVKPVMAAAALPTPKPSPPPAKAATPVRSPPPPVAKFSQAVKPATAATVAAATPIHSPPPPAKPVRSPPPAAKATALASGTVAVAQATAPSSSESPSPSSLSPSAVSSPSVDSSPSVSSSPAISSSPDISGASAASSGGSSSYTGSSGSSYTGSSGSSGSGYTGSTGTGGTSGTGAGASAAMEAAAAGASPSIDLLSAGAPAFAPAPALDAAALLEFPPFQPTADGSTECGFPQGEGAAGKQPPLTSGFADLPGDVTEGTTDTATDEELLPYMARVFGPAANCSGVLIAPGYLLTSGWCMWRGEKALPEQVTVVVGGQAMAVAEVHVRSPVEGEPWRGFQQPKNNNTWDVALLKLATPASLARYATLPTWRSPQEGQAVWATAWQAGSNTTADYAELMVQPCPAEENEAYAAWTDGFCAGGSAVLEGACPEDKGAPLIMAVKDDNGTVVGDYVVGLTSGRMCEPTNATWAYFTDLSDKCILNQILDWILPRDNTAASSEPAPTGSPVPAPAPAPELAVPRRLLQDPAPSPAPAVPAELAAAAPAEAPAGVDANFSQFMLRAVCFLFGTDPCPL